MWAEYTTGMAKTKKERMKIGGINVTTLSILLYAAVAIADEEYRNAAFLLVAAALSHWMPKAGVLTSFLVRRFRRT